MLVAPVGKHFSLRLGSGHSPGDLFDGRHAKRPELAGSLCGRVFVRESTAEELAIHLVGRVGEDGDPRGDTAVNKVGRFEDPGAVGINGHDDDVGRLDGIVDNEDPSGGPEHRSSNGGDPDDDRPRQHDHRRDPGPSRPPSDHAHPAGGETPRPIRPQSLALARSAPSLSARSFAQTTLSATSSEPAKVPNPQSTDAITRLGSPTASTA